MTTPWTGRWTILADRTSARHNSRRVADCAAATVALRMSSSGNRLDMGRKRLPDNAAPVVRTEFRGSIALVLIDNPPVNASSQAVRQGLAGAIEAAGVDPAVEAIVIACEGRTFVAGADIREFGKPPLAPALPEVSAIVEASKKPVVAAVHGTALGGGFELALGLPRPRARRRGAGRPAGSQARPHSRRRRHPAPAAPDRPCATRSTSPPAGGRSPPRRRWRSGIADEIADGDLREAALRAGARRRRAAGPPVERQRRRRHSIAPRSRPRWRRSRRNRAARPRRPSRRAPCCSPPNCLSPRAWRASAPLHRNAAQRPIEGDALRLHRRARGAARAATRRRSRRARWRRVGVIGAGTMGAGISVAFADAGLSRRRGRDQRGGGAGRAPAHRRAMGPAGQIAGGSAADERQARSDRVAVTADFSTLADCDLVVEAAFEDMAVKQEIFARFGAIARARRDPGDQHLLSRRRRASARRAAGPAT